MEGKIAGIPLVLILLVTAIALLIDVPMVLLHTADQVVLRSVLLNQQTQQSQLQSVEKRLVVKPTVTPEVSVTPTKALRPFKSASSSGK